MDGLKKLMREKLDIEDSWEIEVGKMLVFVNVTNGTPLRICGNYVWGVRVGMKETAIMLDKEKLEGFLE